MNICVNKKLKNLEKKIKWSGKNLKIMFSLILILDIIKYNVSRK